MIDDIVRFRVFDYNLAGIPLTEREQAIRDKYKDQHIIYRNLTEEEIKALSDDERNQLGQIVFGQQDRLVNILEIIPDSDDWREQICSRVSKLCEQGISVGHIYCGCPIPIPEGGGVAVNF